MTPEDFVTREKNAIALIIIGVIIWLISFGNRERKGIEIKKVQQHKVQHSDAGMPINPNI